MNLQRKHQLMSKWLKNQWLNSLLTRSQLQPTLHQKKRMLKKSQSSKVRNRHQQMRLQWKLTMQQRKNLARKHPLKTSCQTMSTRRFRRKCTLNLVMINKMRLKLLPQRFKRRYKLLQRKLQRLMKLPLSLQPNLHPQLLSSLKVTKRIQFKKWFKMR